VPDSPKPQKFSPILGLPVDDEPAPLLSTAGPAPEAALQLSVIIPARDEEHNLPTCLASLLAQSDEFFLLGRDWEILVIDDASTDRTRALATELAGTHPGLRVLEAPTLELLDTQRAFTGKTQACWLGAQESQGRWLLFTDADTIHEPGNLSRSMFEAERAHVALLSYSPKQIVTTVAQHALMPLIFSELATVYPPNEINDPAKRIAAANGQFILIERVAYFAAGGHRAVGRSVLEDVDLAWNIKRNATRDGGRGIRLRYAPDALSTRMYTGVADMMEGWTKNLALLFPHALTLSAWRLLDIALLLLPLVYLVFPHLSTLQNMLLLLVWGRTLFRFYRRVARSNFPWLDVLISPLALPMFIYLLVLSCMNHKIFHQVTWKGREYRTGR
jgi:cellulose synthase/poly-beta-1,6-N-acetylglucosamine synthase-like glycosyltransferase